MPTPVHYGSELTADSTLTLTSLGHSLSSQYLRLTALIVSRNGSRQVIRAFRATLVNVSIHGSYLLDEPDDHLLISPHRWEIILRSMLALPREADQKILLWPYVEDRRGRIVHDAEQKHAVGFYVPYTGVYRSYLSQLPVNPIPTIRELRAELAKIAHGWDLFWHSRYVFSNHLRQQVVSRIVDGLLAYCWGEIAKVETTIGSTTDSVSAEWHTLMAITTGLILIATGPITGDPAMWSRALARNIDIEAFRLRLVKGEIPGVNMSTTPWSPTAHTLIKSPITKGNINEKSAAIAKWHESNLLNTENVVLDYHDDELQRVPEKTYGYEDGHEHNPLRR